MKRLFLCLCLVSLGAAACAQDNWPEFRGPNADGRSSATGLPLTWGDTKNVRWKTAIHGRGWSTPVVWGDQVWLTTATDTGSEQYVLCVDRNTGKILLDRKLFENASPAPRHDLNSYASPSPVIEAGRVYVHFGNYGTACLDTKTFKILWTRRDLTCDFEVGPGSSPVLYGNMLILTMDGMDKQFTIALDKKNGATIWKQDRSTDFGDLSQDQRKSFNTPVFVAENGKTQMISSGAQAAFGYDPRNGKELWRLRFRGFSHSSRPLLGPGIVYLNTGFGRPDLLAVRLGGSGDITESHVLWRYGKNVPAKPSPLLIGDLLYFVDDSGVATCLEAKTGKEVWKHRLGDSFSASPVYADGRIYCFSEAGKVTILKPGRQFESLAENEMPAGFMASPAIAGKALYLRTKTHLYRVEN